MDSLALSEVPAGRRVVLQSLPGGTGLRLAELGFLPGATVEVRQRVALGGPVVLGRAGFVVAVRRDDAAGIRVRMEAP